MPVPESTSGWPRCVADALATGRRAPEQFTLETAIEINQPLLKRLFCASTAIVLLAACGQHSGVADHAVSQAALPNGSSTVANTVTSSSVSAANASDGIAGASDYSVTSSVPGPASSGPSGPDPSGSVIDARPGNDVAAQVEELVAQDKPPASGSTVGIVGNTIHLGMHFPVTGSSPNPYQTVSDFNIYWNHLKREGRRIGGRYVTMRSRDDRSTPSDAATSCRELAELETRAFALVGFAGPPQIQACAHYALQTGIPYLAPGSSRYPLEGMSTHFSLSAPYPSQASLISRILLQRFGGDREKNAWLRTNGGNEGDLEATKDTFAREGLTFENIYTIDARPDAQQMQNVIVDMRQRGIQNVYFGATPFHFIYFWQAARVNGFKPQMLGPGLTVTVDDALKAACGADGAADGSLFLSPYPAFNERAKWDPAFKEAVAEMPPGSDNELNWWIWNISKSVEELLRLAGQNLTRERLLWFTAHAPLMETGLMPPLRYSPSDHFADESMHLLRARCDGESSEWVGAGSFLPL